MVQVEGGSWAVIDGEMLTVLSEVEDGALKRIFG